MAPIIASLSANSFSSTGGVLVPEQFDSMLVGAGGYNSGGGAGGIISFTDPNGNTNQGYSFHQSSWDLRGLFTVTVGAPGTGDQGGSSQIDAYNSSGTLVTGAKQIAYGGGRGGTYDSDYGRNGASGGGGYGCTCPASGGTATTGIGFGPYYGVQGHAGGTGYRVCCYSNYWGGGGGFSSTGSAAGSGTHGIGGSGTNPSNSIHADQFWLGISDNSPYNGRFSRGWNHNEGFNGQPGDGGGYAGVVAIRYDNIYDDPVVTGSPSFYDDTTNNKRIIVWTGAGTFQW